MHILVCMNHTVYPFISFILSSFDNRFTNVFHCHKSWLSKEDFTWLIVISHKVCLCFTLCSQLTHSSHMTRTCMSSLCYDWLMFLWLTIVSHNDVMTFARDSHYESRVPRRWHALRTWYVLCFMIDLRHVAQWLIGVIWWISGMTHYES